VPGACIPPVLAEGGRQVVGGSVSESLVHHRGARNEDGEERALADAPSDKGVEEEADDPEAYCVLVFRGPEDACPAAVGNDGAHQGSDQHSCQVVRGAEAKRMTIAHLERFEPVDVETHDGADGDSAGDGDRPCNHEFFSPAERALAEMRFSAWKRERFTDAANDPNARLSSARIARIYAKVARAECERKGEPFHARHPAPWPDATDPSPSMGTTGDCDGFEDIALRIREEARRSAHALHEQGRDTLQLHVCRAVVAAEQARKARMQVRGWKRTRSDDKPPSPGVVGGCVVAAEPVTAERAGSTAAGVPTAAPVATAPTGTACSAAAGSHAVMAAPVAATPASKGLATGQARDPVQANPLLSGPTTALATGRVVVQPNGRALQPPTCAAPKAPASAALEDRCEASPGAATGGDRPTAATVEYGPRVHTMADVVASKRREMGAYGHHDG